jgi:hypothetical protein
MGFGYSPLSKVTLIEPSVEPARKASGRHKIARQQALPPLNFPCVIVSLDTFQPSAPWICSACSLAACPLLVFLNWRVLYSLAIPVLTISTYTYSVCFPLIRKITSSLGKLPATIDSPGSSASPIAKRNQSIAQAHNHSILNLIAAYSSLGSPDGGCHPALTHNPRASVTG